MLQVKWQVLGILCSPGVMQWGLGEGFVATLTGLLLLCYLQLKAPGSSSHILSSFTQQRQPNASPEAAILRFCSQPVAPISNVLSTHHSHTLKRKPKLQNLPNKEQDRLKPRLRSQTGSTTPISSLVLYAPAE